MVARAKATQPRRPTVVWPRCCAALMGFFASAIIAQAAAPDIDSISPLAIRPGISVEVTFSGSGLSEATNVWANFPASFDSLREGRFRVTVAKDSPAGVGAVRLYGSNGVSQLKFLMLDELPTVTESSSNKTRVAAQAVELNSAIDGQCDELSYDWFKLRANKGQRVSLDTVAARVGSKLDSVLRVVNASGRELASNDDAPGQSGDSYLSFTAPETGDYSIELRDVNYGGGSAFFYRLRIGGAPFANSLFASAPRNGIFEVEEREPNDTSAKATKVSLADGVAGRFDKPGDRDCYEFAAHKSDQIEFRAATRSLGSPCDAMLQLESAEGMRLARSNPTAADEGVLRYSFASNGTYRLTVEEATGAFGSNMFYRITTRPAAGFALTLDSDRVNVAPGKNFDLKVNITRGDYKGAVTLRLANLSDIFACTNNIIAEGKSNVTMRVVAPDKLAPGMWQTFSVVGTAKRGGREVEMRASTAPAWRKQLPLRLYPPPEFDGEVTLGVITP